MSNYCRARLRRYVGIAAETVAIGPNGMARLGDRDVSSSVIGVSVRINNVADGLFRNVANRRKYLRGHGLDLGVHYKHGAFANLHNGIPAITDDRVDIALHRND